MNTDEAIEEGGTPVEEQVPVPDDDSSSDELELLRIHASLTPAQKEANRLARQPRIDHLKPGVAVVNGIFLPLFDTNDRIVVERRMSTVPGRPWLDTRVLRVTSIDDETGVVKCYDEDLNTCGSCYVTFKDPLHQEIRLAGTKKKNPFIK